MSRLRFALPFTFLLLAAPIFGAGPTTEPSLKGRVDALIKQLDSDAYQDRQAAADAANALPGEALPLLAAAAARTNLTPEVRLQLESIAKKIKENASKQTRYQTYLAFTRKQLGGEYDRVGKKNPKWDKYVHTLLETEARLAADSISDTAADLDESIALRALQDAGCDDPLIVYFQVARGKGPSTPPDLEKMCDIVLASEYSAYRKFNTLIFMAHEYPVAKTNLAAPPYFEKAVNLLPEIIKVEKDFPADILFSRLASLLAAAEKQHVSLQQAYDAIDASLAKSLPEENVTRLNLKGHFLVQYAWEARGGGYAGTVTEEGGKLFQQRLAEAEKTLARCYELFPNDWQAPCTMINVELGQGQGRDRMELWFSRALKNNPGSLQACNNKMQYLLPRWYGSKEEQLAFGRECLATQQFDTGVPLLVVEGHAAMAPRPPMGSVVPNPYYAKEEVWADIKDAYEGFLPLHPDAWQARSDYARLAFTAGKWKEASQLYKELSKGPSKFRSADGYKLAQLELPIRLKQAEPNADPTIRVMAAKKADAAYTKHIMVDEYERVGKKNPKWDADARAALTAMAAALSNDPDRNFSENDTQLDASKRALDAGCDDPLVRFAHSILIDSQVTPIGPAYRAKSLPDAMALADSQYGATVRALALTLSAIYCSNFEPPREEKWPPLRAALDKAESLLPAMLKESPDNGPRVRFLAGSIGETHISLGDELPVINQRLHDNLAAAGLDEQSLTSITIKINYTKAFVLYQARRVKPPAPGTKPAPADDFRTYMKADEKLCTEYWQKYPDDPYIPQVMMMICPTTHPTKDWLDFWYRQALIADPDDVDNAHRYFESCDAVTKSWENLQEFVRQCAGRSYRSQFPFIQVDFMVKQARIGPNGRYMPKPSNDRLADESIWGGIAEIYEGYLAKFPLDSDRRSEYASYACHAARWTVAAEQFKLLGPHVRPRAFESQERLDACRKHVEELMGKGFLPPAQPAGN